MYLIDLAISSISSLLFSSSPHTTISNSILRTLPTSLPCSNPISIKSYFLGKKAYIDKLTNDNGEIAYHIRMKGVTNTCITLQAIKQFNSDPMELYKYLSEGKKINFNLTDVKAKFKNNKNRTISNINDFKRNIKFSGQLNVVN